MALIIFETYQVVPGNALISNKSHNIHHNMYSILCAFVFLYYPSPIHYRAGVDRSEKRDVIIYEQPLPPEYDTDLAPHDASTENRPP